MTGTHDERYERMAGSSEDKNRLGIILAVIAGLLALGMTFVFLKRMKDTGETQTVAPQVVGTKRILVATRDLPAGHVLNVNNDLQEMNIPDSDDLDIFVRSCVDANHVQELDGRQIGTALPARFPLFYSNLIETYDLAKKFTEGFLKTIALGRENLFGSHLTPGDHVDILVTMPKKKESKPAPAAQSPAGPDSQAAVMSALLASLPEISQANAEMETITILENAEVFMIGSLLKMDRMQLGYLPQSEDGETSEVTFRLSKADAVKLTQYQNTPGATLSLLLRPRAKSDK